jgi:uncharacterized protein YjbK
MENVMTHDELLEKIDYWFDTDNFHLHKNALRAVVELHKPDKEGLCAMNCVVVDDDGYAWTQQQYPCDTIQAIEKELA